MYWLIEPEISSSATIGGWRVLGPRYFRSISAPPAFMLARNVRRMSMMWPCRFGARRRVFTSSIASTMRLIASLACAISAALICAKSFFCSTSRSDTVKRASSSISRSSGGFLSFMPANSASCTRLRAGLRRLGRGGRRLRGEHREQLVEIGALAEKHPERLIEQHRMLVPLHEHGVERPVEILARADTGRRHGGERIEHRARPDRNAGGAQRAREIHDVGGKPSRLRSVGHSPTPPPAVRRAPASSNSFARVPSMRAMSS